MRVNQSNGIEKDTQRNKCVKTGVMVKLPVLNVSNYFLQNHSIIEGVILIKVYNVMLTKLCVDVTQSLGDEISGMEISPPREFVTMQF